MVKKIMSVLTSADGKTTYATDVQGNVLFARSKDMAASLKEGAYVNVVAQLQTKRRNAAGELVDIPVEEQTNNLIITAVFADRNAALAANAETEVFDLETKAYARQQVAGIAKTYNVDLADLATV